MNNNNIEAVIIVTVITFVFVLAIAAFYSILTRTDAVEGWWSTETSPSGVVYECFTARNEDGVGIWCAEQ